MKYSYIDKLTCLIDLHLHLDGAISFSSARELAKLQGIKIPRGNELKKTMRVSKDCKNLVEFLEKFAFPCSLIQTPIGIESAFRNLCDELYNSGHIYAEIRFAPYKSMDKGMNMDDVVSHAIKGIRGSKLKSNLILCCMRGDNDEINLQVVETAYKYLNKGVVAVDLAGAEGLYPTSDYKKVFALANKYNIPITIHAGESDGPRSILDALELGASRIGHGVRCLEDTRTVEILKERQIPLEVAPTSNIQTCTFKSYRDYPLRKLIDEGLNVTLNTDDPSIEGTSLQTEFKKMIKYMNLTKDEVKKLLINSANSAYVIEKDKQLFINKIEENFK